MSTRIGRERILKKSFREFLNKMEKSALRTARKSEHYPSMRNLEKASCTYMHPSAHSRVYARSRWELKILFLNLFFSYIKNNLYIKRKYIKEKAPSPTDDPTEQTSE